LQLEPGDKLPEPWQGPVVLLRFVLLYLFYCVKRFIIQLQVLFMLNMFFWFHFNVIVYMAVCLVRYCFILQIMYFIVMFMYSYCYVCSVLYILFSSCQLALFSNPD